MCMSLGEDIMSTVAPNNFITEELYDSKYQMMDIVAQNRYQKKKEEDEARLDVEFVVIRNSPETAAIVMHSLTSLSERQLGCSMC